MQINNINFGNVNKTDNSNQAKTSWFNRFLPNDLFVKKENKFEQLSKEFDKMNKEKWGNKFGKKEKEEFNEYIKKDFIDIPTIDKFASNSDFDLFSISSVYMMGKYLNDENFADKVVKSFDKCGKNCTPKEFRQSVFEPEKEYSIEVKDKINPYKTETYYFDTKTKDVIGKSKRKINYETGKEHLYEVTSEDYRNHTKSVKTDTLTGFVVKSEVIEHYTPDGRFLRKDVLEESDVNGVYNLRYEFPNGKTKDIVKATIDPKTGIKTIKKDMRSSDGTKTEFLYEDDPQGNRIVDYKITDTNGKILMKNSQTFEVIDKNHFVSSKNGHVYDIKTDENSLTVKDLKHSGKEATIEFKEKIKGEQNEIINVLKKIPGEELFEIVDCVKQLNGNKKVADSYFKPFGKQISTGDNLFVFLHELGHAKDAESKYVNNDPYKTGTIYKDNPNIRKIYLKEREEFNKHFPQEQRENISYFTQKIGHYGKEWGGLSELIAETNAILNVPTNGEIKELSVRSQYLQQHFPRTIATIQDAMNYKNDVEAINYYGT